MMLVYLVFVLCDVNDGMCDDGNDARRRERDGDGERDDEGVCVCDDW